MKIFINLNNRLRRFYDRLKETTRVENLPYFRIILGIVLLKGASNLSYLGTVPDALFRPHVLNMVNIFDSWPPSLFFSVTYYSTIVCAFLVIIGVKTRISLIILGVIGILQSGFGFSFGKIDHAILMYALVFAMSFTNCGSEKALWPDKPLKSTGMSMAVLSILIAFAFLTAGVEKALVWIDFDTSTSGFLSWYYPSYYSIGRSQLLSPWVLHFPWWLTEIMDYAAVIFELTAFFFLFKGRKAWFTYLVIASIFHLLNTLLLNIPFKLHILVFGVWLLTPYFKKYKFFMLLLPLVFFFKNIYFPMLGWLIITVLGVILIVRKKATVSL